ncbi:hypothetical protein Scep_011456 [Stephania cephalantha]|uniref:Uncharacterized protein n=1 Tax=Stephania cephalantha TaxID=152367 RepID=A0AAP0JF74_9MAGN
MDDDNFIDDTGVDPADRYGSDNEGFIGDAPQLEKGHETRESLDILLGKALLQSAVEVLWPRVPKRSGSLAVRLTLLERSFGATYLCHYKFERRFCLPQFKPNQGMVTRRNLIYRWQKAEDFVRGPCKRFTNLSKLTRRSVADKYKDSVRCEN